MRKILIVLMVVLSVFVFGGCGKTKAEVKMSEQTKIVFAGAGEEGDCLICVGERENPYIIDGKHGQNTGFTLINFKPTGQVDSSQIMLKIEIDGVLQNIVMELNPINMTFVVDLGYCVAEQSSIRVSYQQEMITLNNISQTFDINYSQAIEIGFQEVEKNDTLANEEYECYLKLFEGEKFGREGYFWCFSVVGENRNSKNILISVQDGEIILG